MPFLESPPPTADVVIAGGGTSGCVVAARLASALPHLSILVIEAGPDGTDNPTVTHPALFGTHIAPGSAMSELHLARPEPALAGRRVVIASGRALGGGSAVNMVAYTRPPAGDFDAWGVPGWSGAEMIEAFKKFETYHGETTDTNVHGYDGPIHVSGGTYRTPRAEDAFLTGAEKIGLKVVPDVQGMRPAEVNAVQRLQRFVAPDTGRRQDAAECYLRPRLGGGHDNLNVLVGHQIVRVVVDEHTKRAVAVECLNNGTTTTIQARRMVVVSCGAIGSPLVLQRSGIGPADVLKKAGIPVLVDLPVGENYMDHQLAMYAYRSTLTPTETLDALARGQVDVPALIEREDPFLSWNGQDVAGKIRPSPKEVINLGKDFESAWEADFAPFPDRPLHLVSHVSAHTALANGPVTGQFFTLTVFSAYPYSRGHVRVTGPNISDEPDIRTGFLSDEKGLDMAGHMWAYKKTRELARRMPTYRGEEPALHPPFSEHSGAALASHDSELGNVGDLAYSSEDDKVLEKWLRENIGTTWHSSGTCRMGGVVDGRMAVQGVVGLRVVDLSVLPGNVAANTCSTALAVGERAAEIFVGDLGDV